jgi:hypothetical protein
MNCLANLAQQAQTIYEPIQTQIVGIYNTTSADQQPVLKPLVDFQFHGPLLLSSAIDSTNGKVVSNSINASAAPDISGFRTTLISQTQDAVTKQLAFTAAANSKAPGSSRSLRFGAQLTAKDIQTQIDFVAAFDSAVTACIAEAN